MSQVRKTKEWERALRTQARKTRRRLKIENCQFEFECPKRWDQLKDDGQLDSRYCDSCKQRVYLCVTDEEWQARAAAGECVVIFRDDGTASRSKIPERQDTLGVPRWRSPDES